MYLYKVFCITYLLSNNNSQLHNFSYKAVMVLFIVGEILFKFNILYKWTLIIKKLRGDNWDFGFQE